MTRRWSKLKSRVEALWVATLPMAIHANVWVKHTTHWNLDEPRHWVTLDKTIIWDFPGPFMKSEPPRGRRIVYWEDAYGWGGGRKSSVVASLLRNYLDRGRHHVLEPFEHDHWELGDILRGADRRIGHKKLVDWSERLDQRSPARIVVERRCGPRAPLAGT